MSAKVKQANFRLPLPYMDLIDEVAQRENITKAAVITRALDCLKASYDAGEGGRPMTGAASSGASDAEIEKLKARLEKAEERAERAERSLDAAESRANAAESRASAAERGRGSDDSRIAAAEQARDDMQRRLQNVEQERDIAEARVKDAYAARDTAEARLRDAESRLAAAEARAATVSRQPMDPYSAVANEEELTRLRILVQKREASFNEQSRILASKDEELIRLRTLVAKHEASLEEKASVYATREGEIAKKNAAIAERDARIASLSEQLGAANAKIELARTANEVKAVMVGDAPEPEDEDTARALYMFNMLGGVMGAFQQQVADARVIGEQEGRSAVQREFQDSLDKARNDGYREAMTYLDDRVSTAREGGAREERARIANMGFFERQRYLRMHLA